MSRLLVLDSYLDPRGGAHNYVERLEASGAEVEVVQVAHEPLPMRVEHDGVVITGSAASVVDEPEWLERLEALLLDTTERGTPVLGVCFGHQLLARTLWGKQAVRRSATPELGWLEITLTAAAEEDELFRGLPATFPCFVSHDDEVAPDHPEVAAEARLLAFTPDCAVHAYRDEDRLLWGVQFHSEMGFAESEELVRERAESKGLDPEPILAKRVATDEVIETLLANFAGVVETAVAGRDATG